MLPPEVESGNREYKRFLINLEEDRLQELVSQMKWRLSEGNGIAYYYIGINDDGSVFGLNKLQVNTSMKNFRQIIEHANVIIEKVKKIYVLDKKERLKLPLQDRLFYFEIEIKQKQLKKKYKEKRILLIGHSGVGKTTFLSYLIKGKLDTMKTKARLHILNHKHEIESGKTSSLSYYYYIYNDIKYVFLDTPGDIEYAKTRNKIILSCEFDLAIYFYNPNKYIWNTKGLYYNYIKYKNVPWIEINLYSNINDLPNINMLKPPKQELIFDYIISKINEKNIMETKDTNFILLKTFPHPDLGWILSGFLKSGSIKVNQELFWYSQHKHKVKVQSIHIDNRPVKKIVAPITATICLDKLKHIENKPKYGFLTNKIYNIETIVTPKWIWKGHRNIPNNLNGYIDNTNIILNKIDDSNNYKIIYCNTNFNIKGKIFITESSIFKGICLL